MEATDIDGIRVRVAHVRSLGLGGAILAALTMLAAVGVGLVMLFGRALLAAAIFVIAWPYIFSPEFTKWVFGAEAVPYFKLFILIVTVGTLGRIIFRGK